MAELEDWALENAARLAADVERHGIAMTWGEAYEQLLRVGHFLEVPAYLEDGEEGLVSVGSATPAWQRPEFAENVASGFVVGAGKPFFPRDPATSGTAIAIPWALASELVTRLSLVLSDRLRASADTRDAAALAELSGLVVSLSVRISEELACQPADGTGMCTLEDEPYLLMRARDVWTAATLLHEVDASSSSAESTPDRDDVLVACLAGRQATDTFLWDLDWWITPRSPS